MKSLNISCFGKQNTTVKEPMEKLSFAINSLTPTGNYNQDKQRAEEYAALVGMNPANKKMAVVMATEGPQAAAKAMIEDCGNDYFAMRMKYG